MAHNESDSADIYQRIQRGDFDCKIDYPQSPKPPAVLRMPVSQLTTKEFVTLQSVKDKYDADVKKWKDALAEYRKEESILDEEFRKSALEEFGMDIELPLSTMLYALAWDRGHSCGFAEVALHLSDMQKVYEEAIRMRDEAARSAVA